MSNEHQEALLKSLRWLRVSQEYSDLKVICQDKIFPVHKAVLCSRSKFFANACKWGTGDTPREEVNLEDDDPTHIGMMLDYLYQLDYDDLLPSQHHAPTTEEPPVEADPDPAPPAPQHAPPPAPLTDAFGAPPEPQPSSSTDPERANWVNLFESSKKGKKSRKSKKPPRPRPRDSDQDVNISRLVVNTQMYALAEKYEIETLKTLAKEKFEIAVEQDWDSQSFIRATELIFETTPSSDQGLRAIVVHMVDEHRELVDDPEFQRLFESGNGIAWAILQVVLKKSPPQQNPPRQPNNLGWGAHTSF